MHALLLAALIGLGGQVATPVLQARTEMFRLRYSRPSRFVELVGFPAKGDEKSALRRAEYLPGITSLLANDDLQTVTAMGNAEGLQELRGMVSLLDIVPRTVELDIVLSRLAVTPDGPKREEIISSHTARAPNDEPYLLSSRMDNISFDLKVVARVNGDDSCSAFIDCTINNHSSGRKNSASFPVNRRFKPGDPPFKFGLADSAAGEKFYGILPAKIPVTGSYYSVYFVRVKPTLEPRQ